MFETDPLTSRAAEITLEGCEYQGAADAITDHAEVTRVLGRFLKAQPGYGKYVGLKSGPDGRMNPAEVEAVARERVVVRARPTQG